MSARQKIVQGHGPSNINLDIFVCLFDVCQASEPLQSMNYRGIILVSSIAGMIFGNKTRLL